MSTPGLTPCGSVRAARPANHPDLRLADRLQRVGGHGFMRKQQCRRSPALPKSWS